MLRVVSWRAKASHANRLLLASCCSQSLLDVLPLPLMHFHVPLCAIRRNKASAIALPITAELGCTSFSRGVHTCPLLCQGPMGLL